MVYYFSGTGNSEFVAKRLAVLLKLSAKRITKIDPKKVVVDKTKPFIIVYPTLAFGMPKMVENFLDQVDFSKCYSVLITTCAGDSGGQLVKYKRKYGFNHLNEIFMPNNYIISKKGSVQSRAKQENLVNNAHVKLNRISNDITRRLDFTERSKAHFKLSKNLIHNLFIKYGTKTSFVVSSDCTGCGVCENICPDHTIKMKDGHPVWESDTCEMCLRCLHTCPSKAIDYKYSKGKERYLYFPFVK